MKRLPILRKALPYAAILTPLTALAEIAPPRPNVILIMTDYQGYGEIAAHGNPLIKTLHLDKLHA